MSIQAVEIRETDEQQLIYQKKFRFLKSCGEGDDGLIKSVVLGYLDALIISQNTEFDCSTIMISQLSKIGQIPEVLINHLNSISQKQLDFNGFNTLCSTEEISGPLIELGKSIFEYVSFYPDSSTKEPSKGIQSEDKYSLYKFSKAFNVQIHIYEPSKEDPLIYAKNRLTDALIINLFRTVGHHNRQFNVIYHEMCFNLNENNLNISRELFKDEFDSEAYVPLVLFKNILDDLYDYEIPEEQKTKLRAAFTDLNKAYPTWFFSQEYGKLDEGFNPCHFCKKLRIRQSYSCGHCFCSSCSSVVIKLNWCTLCYLN